MLKEFPAERTFTDSRRDILMLLDLEWYQYLVSNLVAQASDQ